MPPGPGWEGGVDNAVNQRLSRRRPTEDRMHSGWLPSLFNGMAASPLQRAALQVNEVGPCHLTAPAFRWSCLVRTTMGEHQALATNFRRPCAILRGAPKTLLGPPGGAHYSGMTTGGLWSTARRLAGFRALTGVRTSASSVDSIVARRTRLSRYDRVLF
jgi:hypothetical protein